jgi:hypothetical protein
MKDTVIRIVFDALGRFVTQGHRLTVLIGNHDVELVFPNVQGDDRPGEKPGTSAMLDTEMLSQPAVHEPAE